MNPFSYFSKKRREQRKKLKELRQFSSVFTTLDRLEQSGLLTFDAKSRRLFIAQSLALLMMRDAESWVNFVQNVYLWLTYQECQRLWSEHFLKEELASVRRASREPVGTVPAVGSDADGKRTAEGLSPSGSPALEERNPLSRADVERIRLAARQQVAESDIEPPKVEPFEMFIVEDTVDAKPKIIAVGYFDPETNAQELAPWSEVEPLIRKSDGQAGA